MKYTNSISVRRPLTEVAEAVKIEDISKFSADAKFVGRNGSMVTISVDGTEVTLEEQIRDRLVVYTLVSISARFNPVARCVLHIDFTETSFAQIQTEVLVTIEAEIAGPRFVVRLAEAQIRKYTDLYLNKFREMMEEYQSPNGDC